MRVITRTSDVEKARVIVAYLRANGIDAQLLDAATPYAAPAARGVRIAVPECEEAQAHRLLKEAEQKDGDDGKMQ